jgi:hypothetical protein
MVALYIVVAFDTNLIFSGISANRNKDRRIVTRQWHLSSDRSFVSFFTYLIRDKLIWNFVGWKSTQVCFSLSLLVIHSAGYGWLSYVKPESNQCSVRRELSLQENYTVLIKGEPTGLCYNFMSNLGGDSLYKLIMFCDIVHWRKLSLTGLINWT